MCDDVTGECLNVYLLCLNGWGCDHDQTEAVKYLFHE